MFGDRLQGLRTDVDLTQEELAKKLQVSRSVLSKYEINENEPDINFIVQCAKYFNVSTDYLLCNTKLQTPQNVVFNLNNKTTENTMKKLNTILFKFNENGKYIDYVYEVLNALKNFK